MAADYQAVQRDLGVEIIMTSDKYSAGSEHSFDIHAG
jgi:hypothetical protein